MCWICSWRSPAAVRHNQATLPIKPEVMAEGNGLHFLDVPMWVLHRSHLHIVSHRQIDNLTLQVDKCVLTTLGEISTWSAGSLPGTRFYLHLLRLAEETFNLLHDLWLQFWNPPPCSLLFGCHPDFSSFCFVVLSSHWLIWAISPLLSPHLPCIRPPLHVSLWQTCAWMRAMDTYKIFVLVTIRKSEKEKI